MIYITLHRKLKIEQQELHEYYLISYNAKTIFHRIIFLLIGLSIVSCLELPYLKEASFTEIEWEESTCNFKIDDVSKFHNV